ncbi:HopJ type III effector protein [Acinetobacter venetianus]|nr:HopJ type III effector protein [Acinetobacter venetianus]KXZ65057.1 HopJ type III effector protein [Acinetobacter venetianus]
MILAFSEVDMEFKMAQSLLAQLKDGSAKFADVLAFIEARYQHTPTTFQNGAQFNAATENQGSAKVLTFAKLEGLNQQDTLSLFAEHYASVLATPEATDHQNIRQFMQNGWDGVKFEGEALTAK